MRAGAGDTAAADRDGVFLRRGRSRGAARGDLSAQYRLLRAQFVRYIAGEPFAARVRATYPFIRITTASHARLDSRLAYGFVSRPGVHETTVTRPDLFRHYFIEQMRLLIAKSRRSGRDR
jgi:hypothetical protein